MVFFENDTSRENKTNHLSEMSTTMLTQYANVQPCSEQGDAAIVQHLIDAITKRGTNNSNDDVRFVMIGTSTLGTEQFLRVRSQLTRQLIERHGFSMLAIEADYPDGFELNQYVQGLNGYAPKVIDESSSSPSSPSSSSAKAMATPGSRPPCGAGSAMTPAMSSATRREKRVVLFIKRLGMLRLPGRPRSSKPLSVDTRP